ncbi:MAG: hypothetical protein U5R06_17330 [candidate division KSB1 bacterium]|nr:hypothetical protein [candidate division KSB1 bacterium]
MTTEVWEVFELLEFHNILRAFDSIKDAAADFAGAVASGQEAPPTSETVTIAKDAEPHPSVQPDDSSLDDKIKEIVAKNPDAGTGQIARMLNSVEYGNIKMGRLKVRKRLKKLGLNSKSDRYKYSRQYS